jgi:hypothetical protein
VRLTIEEWQGNGDLVFQLSKKDKHKFLALEGFGPKRHEGLE